jgi:hypothetical protein
MGIVRALLCVLRGHGPMAESYRREPTHAEPERIDYRSSVVTPDVLTPYRLVLIRRHCPRCGREKRYWN